MDSRELDFGSLASSLPLLLDRWGESRLRTCMPGVVVSFDTASGRSVVQPALDMVRQDGSQVARSLLADVPVVFPGARGHGIVYQLEAGDHVLLFWSSRGLDAWKRSGYVQAPGGEPFQASGCFALPIRFFDVNDDSGGGGGSSVELTGVESISGGGGVTLTFTATGLTVDVPAGQSVKFGDPATVKALLNDTFIDLFNAHRHGTSLADVANNRPSGVPTVQLGKTGAHVTGKVRGE